MKVFLAPDAKRLLMAAGREITRARRGRLIEDIAADLDIHDLRLDEILKAFMHSGFWAMDGLKLRQGYVTPRGLAVAADQALRAA